MQRVKPQLSYETLKKMYLAKYESGNQAESSNVIVSRTSLTPVNPQVADHRLRCVLLLRTYARVLIC